MTENKKLERNPMNKVIGGVCSGLADYFNFDVALVRVLFVTALLFASFGFWLYIILWIVIPEKVVNFNFTEPKNDIHDNETDSVDDDTAVKDNNKKTTALLSGIFIIFIGVILLINNFIPISWVWKLWPLILVGIGIMMIVKTSSKGG